MPRGTDLLVVALVSLVTVELVMANCDPRYAKLSCLQGCRRCTNAYGRLTYNMAACCQECVATKSDMVDNGPRKCSKKFLFKDEDPSRADYFYYFGRR